MAVLLGSPALQAPKCFNSLKGSETPKTRQNVSLEELFDHQLALVKTVRNTDWLELIRKLRTAADDGGHGCHIFRTSVTLPPPGAVNMRLFGEPRTNCAGLVWDRSRLDLSEAYIWPSGYMAKTEFNLTHKGELVNGRSSALVTMDRLVECNHRRWTTNAETGEMQEVADGACMSFNEINWPCKGTHGISAVFVRTMELGPVLHALGVIALLDHALGLRLPLLLLDSVHPVCLLDETILEAYLRQAMPPAHLERWPAVLVPRLPIDLSEMHFSDMEKLNIHAMYGLRRSSLWQLFAKYTDDPVRFHELLSAGLKACAALRNVPSAREIVRATSFYLLGFCKEETKCQERRLLTEVIVLAETLPDHSEDLQVVLGAEVMLLEFRSGQTKRRIERAIEELGDWLRKVDSQCTVCDFFSWVETWKKERTSRVSSFISGKAVANRKDFLKHLKKLRDANDGEFVRELYEVVKTLRSPCLRFHMLRDVLGLDRRFSRNVVHAIVCFAFDIFVPRASSAFEVDESTRLEAEETGGSMGRRPSREILGVETPEDFSADPLGIETRLFRALYRENRSRKFS